MRSSPSCKCCSPHVSLCVVTPPSFRYQQRWGLAAGLLYSWAVALRATSTPQTPLGWTKKIKFFVVSLCVLCHKPYITLLHIQTLMCGVVWWRGAVGMIQQQEGKKCPPQHGPHHPAPSHLPFSFSFSHAQRG